MMRSTLLLCLVCGVASAQGEWSLLKADGYEDIDVAAAYSLWEGGAHFLDVRTASEYASGHIEDAVNIPVDELSSRLDEITAAAGDTIVVYCLAGSRSAQAAPILVNGGFTAVKNMLGGITAWEAAGYAVSDDEGTLNCTPAAHAGPMARTAKGDVALLLLMGMALGAASWRRRLRRVKGVI